MAQSHMSDHSSILVLGDSAGAPLGGCFETYLDLFCQGLFDRKVTVHNASGVGMTAADALIHLRERLESDRPDAVVLHLGNCDACGYGYIKPRTMFWRKGKASLNATEKYRRANPMAVRQKPYMYKEMGLGSGLRRCVSARDFGDYHADMIKLCRSKGVGLLILNGRSKSDFIPCLNTGNFPAFKVFGSDDSIRMHADEMGVGLLDALALHAEGAEEKALSKYVMLARDTTSEAGLAAANNAAAIHYGRGEYADARALLASLPSDFAMYSMVLFNMGVLALAEGKASQADELFNRARETDVGSFRIPEAFRKELAKASAKRDVEVVDLGSVIGDADFIDYCHPTREGHVKVLAAVRDRLTEMLGLNSGDHEPDSVYVPLNPDRYAGFETDFFEHYGVAVDPTNAFCRDLLQEARQEPYESVLMREVTFEPDAEKRKRATILGHPLFGMESYLAESPPKTRTDQGRVPEFYFMRHMLPVYEVAEEIGVMDELFPDAQDILPRCAKLNTWLPSLRLDALIPGLDRLVEIFGQLDTGNLLRRSCQLLERHLSSEPSVNNRRRTITYYFFRESFVFGTASHHSLFFQRMDIYRLVDTCLCGLLLTDDEKVHRDFRRLADLVSEVVAVHTKHLEAHAHRIFLLDGKSHEVYATEINSLMTRLAAFREGLE